MIVPASPVSIVVAGQEVRGWTEYSITTALLDPVAQFAMTMPFDLAAWKILRKEVRVKVQLGGVTVLVGFLDTCEAPEGDDVIQVSGRNLVGRLVQESAPSFTYQGLSLTQLIAKLAAPWFTKVTLSNARNRRVQRGKGAKAKSTEAVFVDAQPGGTVAEPGQSRWAIIDELLRQAGLIAWSAGDGTELVIGQPNYAQEPQWRFFHPAAGSSRGAESNVIGMGVKYSTADRYSRVIVTGSGRGTAANYGPAVASRYGSAKDGPGVDGIGGAFAEPKRLVVHEPVQSVAEADDLALHEIERRAAHGTVVSVTAPGHGQLVAGSALTTFATDTLASVEDERTQTRGAFVVAGCVYTSNRKDGERTKLELLRKGVELAT